MSKLRRVLSWAAVLAVLGLLFAGWQNLQAIEDWWRLRNYTPPAAITRLAEADTMTADATHIFYVNHPELVGSADAFRQACPTFEQTIVLGCYQSSQEGIFLYSVSDARLSGVVEVTAAHEMLHAAYERLDGEEKSQINGLLNNYYTKELRDQRLVDTINNYKKTEPNELVNEMHSIFGTEIASLPPQLEDYYKQYFTNRAQVAAHAARYKDEFTSRLDQIRSFEERLNAMKQKIDNQENYLSGLRSQIEADRRRLDSLRASGQTAEYNAAVPAFNRKVNDYNDGVAQLKRDIAEYNRLVAAHNELAAELRTLYQSLDSSLAPQSAQ